MTVLEKLRQKYGRWRAGRSDASVAMSANIDYPALKAWQGAAQQNGCYRISASF